MYIAYLASTNSNKSIVQNEIAREHVDANISNVRDTESRYIRIANISFNDI